MTLPCNDECSLETPTTTSGWHATARQEHNAVIIKIDPIRTEIRRNEGTTSAQTSASIDTASSETISRRSSLEELTYVPGLVGDIVNFIVNSARRPNRLLALGAAVTVIGALIGRRVAGPTKSATHLYVVALAPTGAGKQHPINCIANLLAGAGARDLVGPISFTSSQAIINELKERPNLLCAIDEFGGFLKRISHENAGHYEADITAILRSLWGWCWSWYNSYAAAKTKSVAIACPALSIFGTSTPENFYEALQIEDIGNGFLNRFLILECSGRSAESDPLPSSDRIPSSLEQGLKVLFNPPMREFPPDGSTKLGGVQPCVRLSWGSGADSVYRALSQNIEKEIRPQHRDLKSRVAEMAVRLATIRAAGRGSTEVDCADIEWGRDLAVASAEMLCDGVERYMANELQFSKICPEILVRIRNNGGRMARRDVLRSFQRHVKRGVDIDAALRHLIEAEQIEVEQIPANQKSRKVYKLVE